MALAELADLCGGRLQGTSRPAAGRISKDTRSLQPGDVYLALRGENHDGNLFAAQAVEQGAAAAILDRPECADSLPQDFPVILVDNSLSALHRLARAWRDRLTLKAVGITGSSGKTSTKEFAAAVLSTRYQVVKTQGNLNNHIGLPLSILSASSSDHVAIWEIGMNHPGEIAPLAQLARPDMAIITNIGVAHIEYMGSREAIAEEKGELAAAVGPGGVLILPSEDKFAEALVRRTRGRVVLAGLTRGHVTAAEVTQTLEGCRFQLQAGGESVFASLPVPGIHMVKNALLAAACGLEFGLSLEECALGLSQAKLTGGRLARREIRGATILDDTYNANPDSMVAALEALRALPAPSRRIAVLGRMGELGAHAEEGYRRVGQAAAEAVDALIVVGPETLPVSETARAGGLKEIFEAADALQAADILRNLARPEDVVLVKGSRSARMEQVIQAFSN